MGLTNMSIRKKLLFNMVITCVGLLLISAVAIYNLVQFRNILHSLLYETNEQASAFQELQYDLTRVQGHLHALISARDLASIKSVAGEFNASMAELAQTTGTLQRAGETPVAIQRAGDELRRCFEAVMAAKRRNIALEQEKALLRETLGGLVEEGVVQLVTVLDDNELRLYMAAEKLKDLGKIEAVQLDGFLGKHHSPLMGVLDVLGRFNELSQVAASTGDIADPAFVEPERERVVSALDAIQDVLPEMIAEVSDVDRDRLSLIQTTLPMLGDILLGDSGILAKQTQILEQRQRYARLLGDVTGRISGLVAEARSLAEAVERQARDVGAQAIGKLGRIVATIVAVFLILLIGGGVLSYKLNRNICDPLIQGVVFAETIAKGDLEASLNLHREDEIGELALSLNNMAKNLRAQDWLKTGKSGFDDAMRGVEDVQTLASRSIAFLAKHVDAQLGALYLLDEEQELRLTASYAFSRRNDNFNRVKLGEGLVG